VSTMKIDECRVSVDDDRCVWGVGREVVDECMDCQ
jgi:hypothetical protein